MRRLLAAVVAITLIAGTALAATGPNARSVVRANPTVRWNLAFHPFMSWQTANPNDSLLKVIALHFDQANIENGSEFMAPWFRSYNRNFQSLRYMNVTNSHMIGVDGRKTQDWRTYAVLNSVEPDTGYLHFSRNTWTLFKRLESSGNDSTRNSWDDRLYPVLGKNGSDANLTDFSYWAYAFFSEASVGSKDVGNRLPICQSMIDTLILGHPDKFYEVQFRIKTPSPGANTYRWFYRRSSDSSLVALTVTDGTNNFKQSGKVTFTPPTDWKYETVATGPFSFQVRYKAYCIYVANATGNNTTSWPYAGYIRREDFLDPSRGLGGTATATSRWRVYIPGWNPANDLNADGFVSDAEWGSTVVGSDGHAYGSALQDTSCTARMKHEARVKVFDDSYRWATNLHNAVYRTWLAKWCRGVMQDTSSGSRIVKGAWDCANPPVGEPPDPCMPGVPALSVASGDSAMNGFYEDNCTPNDGSIQVSSTGGGLASGSATQRNLADSCFVGSYILYQPCRENNNCPSEDTTSAPVYEYSDQSKATKLRPGRAFTFDHLKADAEIADTLAAAFGKASTGVRVKRFIGNSSQFYADNFGFGSLSPGHGSNTVKSITTRFGAFFDSANAAQDTGGYFATLYHDGTEREVFGKTKDVSLGGRSTTSQLPTGAFQHRARMIIRALATGKRVELLWYPSYYDSGNPQVGLANGIQRADSTGWYANGFYLRGTRWSNTRLTENQDKMFALGCYYLLASPDTNNMLQMAWVPNAPFRGLGFGKGWSPTPGWPFNTSAASNGGYGSGTSAPESTAWWPAIARQIGYPSTDSVAWDTTGIIDLGGGKFTAGAIQTGNVTRPYRVYGRPFFRWGTAADTAAWVYVRPKFNDSEGQGQADGDPVLLKFSGGKTMHRLNYDGSLTRESSDTIRAGEAIIAIDTTQYTGASPDVIPPTIVWKRPTAGQVYGGNSAFGGSDTTCFRASVSDNKTPCDSLLNELGYSSTGNLPLVRVFYSADGGATFTEIGPDAGGDRSQVFACLGWNSGNCLLEPGGPAAESYCGINIMRSKGWTDNAVFRIVAFDKLGNSTVSYSPVFQFHYGSKPLAPGSVITKLKPRIPRPRNIITRRIVQ